MTPMTGIHHTCDTLIIGAGLAGLSAARTIETHNRSMNGGTPIHYLVLEAGDRIGGRVQSETLTLPEGDDILINPGAQWFHTDIRHGAQENPLLKTARECGASLVHDDMPRQFFNRGVPVNYLGNIHKIQQARRLIDSHEGPDTDLASLFSANRLGTPSSLITTFGEVETGAPLSQVSAVDVRELVACNMGKFTKAGLGQFISRYAEEVMPHVRLKSPVTRINWQPQGREGVVVETADGDSYHAKRCIVTASVGVLKSGAIGFEPPLPPEHAESLSHVSMGNFNKIFILLDKQFRFPVNSNTHLDVHTRGGHDVFYLARDNGQPLVTTFFGGELARLCDRDPEAARKLAIDGLAEIWGGEIRDHIVEARVTRWGNDPLVRGGYSRVDIGHHGARQQLAQPIGSSLYLAGEAMGAVHPETGRNWATHMAGAAISGERAARDVIQSLEKKMPVLEAPPRSWARQ